MMQKLRDALPETRIRVHAGGGKLKNQLKKADGAKAQWALIIGEDEVAGERITIKPLRGQAPQQTLPVAELIELINKATGD
jgi:histidyl-tRNA synthetase